MKSARIRIFFVVLAVTLAILVVPAYRWAFPPKHQHCIKAASFLFLEYAESNNGQFPTSDRGWGDALLKLGQGQPRQKWLPFVVGVDDQGSHLLQALETGTDVDEQACTRIYVQGLGRGSPGDLALLFDRHSVRGGDHFRSPFRKPVREVLLVNGTHRMIGNAEWPDFVETQRTLLRDLGWSATQISIYYDEY